MKAAVADALSVTVTGGRAATTRHIPPKQALAVGMPTAPAPAGWRWALLTDIARLESGHTPSRRHDEWWTGDIPWMSIQDARDHHGRRIDDTAEHTNQLGIDNSSARLLPANTVCLSRTASVGYVVVMGRPMATSQDFVNWICSEQLEPEFLKYLFVAEGDDLLRFASGSVHQTIYFPEVKAFHVCIPPRNKQRRIVAILDEAFEGIATAKANAEKNLENARAVFESQLESVLARPITGSIETHIGAEVELLAGFAFKSAQYTTSGEDVRLLRGDNIVPAALRWDDAKRWRKSDTAEYRGYQLRAGDIVLAMDRPWVKAGLKHAMIQENDLPCLLVQRTARLRVNARVDNRFLMHLIGSSTFTRHIVGIQTGSGVPHISGQQIQDFRFHRPPLAEQRRLATGLDRLRQESARLESIYQRKLDALDELKKSLLHQAFTGQL